MRDGDAGPAAGPVRSTMPPRQTAHAGPVAGAVQVLATAATCYRRHAGVVIGLSLVGSFERAVLQLWGQDWSSTTIWSLELVVIAARVALFLYVFRVLISSDAHLAAVPIREGAHRVARFVGRQWRMLLVQVVLAVVVFVLVEAVPDGVIAPAIPADARPTYWAAVLAIKNPTIIAFTMIWEIALLRHALLLGAPVGEGVATDGG